VVEFREIKPSENLKLPLITSNQSNFIREDTVAVESLNDLFVEQLRDLYDAENQLIKALPKMAEGANSDELRQGFEEHLEQTKGHAQRIEQIFEQLGEKAKGKKCKAMEGLIKEGNETLEEDISDENVQDAAIIAAAQRVEHYEIAGYGTARTFANLLGEDEAASLLEQTLEEEKETDAKLTQLAEGINIAAESEGEESENESRKKSRTTSRRRSAA
jgi:ferritin-like metal-binding protein YciE